MVTCMTESKRLIAAPNTRLIEMQRRRDITLLSEVRRRLLAQKQVKAVSRFQVS